MSMAYPGITHCSECGKRLDGWLGRCESCQQVKKDDKKAITGDKDTAQQVTGKLKLIDILNKIANGELKEGTRMVLHTGFIKGENYKNIELEYCFNNLITEQGEAIFKIKNFNILEDEVELKEPNDFGKADKMAEPTDNTKIEELDAYELDPLKIFYKLNEVIRKLNKED